jgi:hypothetical protein
MVARSLPLHLPTNSIAAVSRPRRSANGTALGREGPFKAMGQEKIIGETWGSHRKIIIYATYSPIFMGEAKI